MSLTTKKAVLITGCSDGGLGSALASAFLSQGYHVFATTRNVSKMSTLSKLPNLTLLDLDVTVDSQIATAVDSVKRTTGRLDILINNAGRNHFSPVLDIDISEAKQIFEINLWGPLALVKAFMPLLMESKGTVVNTTSISGYLNVPYMGLYAATKRSLELVAETLRLEIEPFGVKVVQVVTGAVRSNGQTYFEDWKLPEDSLYKPIEALIANRARGGDGHPREETEKYAKDVVDDIISGKTGKVWRGGNATSTKRATTSDVSQSLLDKGASRDTGLDQLGANKQS
ncbi:Short-chain dehydrogenase [Lachnellula subtilissima]|uniref:Short-chain dehydrogenase n=1 Tax=Lachnellula subtilissima TaxID=602034 RepID=A0A8H8RGW5_9HELO|nr:Short-chain dehydrogenase [Lachnellula subtilissima]